MTFSELTRIMLHSMDFFELRRTAARYEIAFQGVRRNKLIRELEKKIILKNAQLNDSASMGEAPKSAIQSNLEKLQKYRSQIRPILSAKITDIPSLTGQTKLYDAKQN